MALGPGSLSLAGRSAAVTGGGAGIGRGIALGLAALGARVALLEKDPERAHRVAGEIGAAGGTALAIPTDVRDGEEVERAIAATCERFGGIDVLVNNVGGSFVAPFLETNERGWDALWRQNFKHILHCTRSAGLRMVAQGRGGSIVNVVSIEGVRAAPLYAVYAAAKAGAINFTKGRRLYGRYWGCFEELRHLHFNVCYYQGIEHCFGRGLDVFEPGAGGEHKLSRGFEPTLQRSAHYIRDERFREVLARHLIGERMEMRRHREMMLQSMGTKESER